MTKIRPAQSLHIQRSLHREGSEHPGICAIATPQLSALAMRDPADWTEDDLLTLIANQVAESLSLDYKESAALQRMDGRKNELSKDVSALANSAGGVLVYGVRENGYIPVELDAGLDPEDISKEWIEQVINSRISRRIDEVRIRQIPLCLVRGPAGLHTQWLSPLAVERINSGIDMRKACVGNEAEGRMSGSAAFFGVEGI